MLASTFATMRHMAKNLSLVAVSYFFYILSSIVPIYSTVGCSDLALFAIFEKLNVSADQVYFYEVNSQKSANFAERGR